MRYLELRVHRSPNERHPMHQFVVEHDRYNITRLLYGHQYAENEHALLFHVEGPAEPYRNELKTVSAVLEFELALCPDESFYLYIRERISEDDQEFTDAFSQPGLIIVRPIEYRSDETIQLAVVGPSDAIQAAVDDIPETNGVEILAVGEYLASRIDARIELTPRQFEAVTEAVESGYYDVAREASLDDVASRLDCSSGTAGELLRRAERTVMSDLVAGGPF